MQEGQQQSMTGTGATTADNKTLATSSLLSPALAEAAFSQSH
jgi:hypothetical protein